MVGGKGDCVGGIGQGASGGISPVTVPFVGWSLTECLGFAGVVQARGPSPPGLSFYKKGNCSWSERKGCFLG